MKKTFIFEVKTRSILDNLMSTFFASHFILKLFFYLRHKNSRFCHVSIQTIFYTMTERVSLHFIFGYFDSFLTSFIISVSHIVMEPLSRIEKDFCVLCAFAHSFSCNMPEIISHLAVVRHICHYKTMFGFQFAGVHYNKASLANENMNENIKII